MKFFSQITSGNVVLMGAKTFESIGKPLKNRFNIVLTRNKEKYKNQKKENLIFSDDLPGILQFYKGNPKENIFIIGGLEIYRQTYNYADYYYVSIVKGNYEGNIYFYFPDWNKGKMVKKEEFPEFTSYIYEQTRR